jgi:hypothetical protein
MYVQVSAVATGTQVATRLLHFLHPSSLLSEAPFVSYNEFKLGNVLFGRQDLGLV